MRKVKVRINYKDVLVTIKEAEILSGILDGATVVDDTYLEGQHYHYIENEPYRLNMEFTRGDELYKTEDQIQEIRDRVRAKEEDKENA